MPATDRLRLVFDTNVLVSALMIADSAPQLALSSALEDSTLLYSEPTLLELVDVLARPKFDRYTAPSERDRFLAGIAAVGENIEIVRRIRACRDPKDDKFLELAVNGKADAIITGDRDLLEMTPFLGVAIVTPRQLLEHKR